MPALGVPVALAVAHVYYFRLNEPSQRSMFWHTLRTALRMSAGLPLFNPGKVQQQMNVVGMLAPLKRNAKQGKGKAKGSAPTQQQRQQKGRRVGGPQAWDPNYAAEVERKLGKDMSRLLMPRGFETILANAKKRFCKRFQLDEGIALNNALMENLYVCVVCILNRIPVFIVGKPGSSKTLAMQVITSNLQGEQSPRPFWRRFPAVTLFSFQCSPMTQASGILEQFRMACNYQKHAKATRNRTVLVLDEVGLAEHSPDMPLKVLHGMLVDPPIAIVGISNWTLDAAKMNRAICLQRPDPRESDLQMTGECVITVNDESNGAAVPAPASSLPEPSASAATAATTADGPEEDEDDDRPMPPPPQLMRSLSSIHEGLCEVLGPLASAFHIVYKNQKSYSTSSSVDEGDGSGADDHNQEQEQRDFIGMRDYYCMLKMMRLSIIETATNISNAKDQLQQAAGSTAAAIGSSGLSESALVRAICRNFGGKPSLLRHTLDVFYTNMFLEPCMTVLPTPRELIEANLDDFSARHLMLLTEHSSALHLLFDMEMLEHSTASVLVGSHFPEDRSELRLVQQITQVKRAMAAGRVVVLVNHDQIYEALYDVLNQRYITRTSAQTNKVTRMLRLAIGAKSQLCPVAEGFRVVVVAEQQHAYSNLDLPLLNRFEKQVFTPRDVMTDVTTGCAGEVED